MRATIAVLVLCATESGCFTPKPRRTARALTRVVRHGTRATDLDRRVAVASLLACWPEPAAAALDAAAEVEDVVENPALARRRRRTNAASTRVGQGRRLGRCFAASVARRADTRADRGRGSFFPVSSTGAGRQPHTDTQVWKIGDNKGDGCSPQRLRRAFPGPFVNYLSRFLLAYDAGSRAFWRASGAARDSRGPTLDDEERCSAEIPLSWDEGRVKRKRAQQFAQFAKSVETGLGTYAVKSVAPDGELSKTPQLGVRQLLSLVRSRYGAFPDAQRQLALCFSLLEPALQPTEAISALAAAYENASVAAIEVQDGGSFACASLDAVGALERATLPAPALFYGRQSAGARLGAPRLAGAGVRYILRAFLGGRREKHDVNEQNHPQVPTGRVVGAKVTERGCGYDPRSPPDVRLATQSGAVFGRARVDAKGRLDRVELDAFAVPPGDDVVVEVAPPADNSACGAVPEVLPVLEYTLEGVDVPAGQAQNFGYTSAQSLELRLPFYDEQIQILRTPRASAVLRKDLDSRPGPPQTARWAPRDAASTSLTALLGPGLVPRFDGQHHAFPAVAFGRIEAASRSMRAVAAPVRKPLALNNGQLLRLGLAGALGSSATRAALNPLELSKVRAQAAAARGEAGEAEAVGPWKGIQATAASGAALGTSSFGVYETLARALPAGATRLFGPAFATANELQISLAASLGAAVAAAALVAPLEAAKVRLMTARDDEASLYGALVAVATDGRTLRPARLWDGFGPLLARELPFTSAKLLVYSSAQQLCFSLLPAARERPVASFLVTVACGAAAGAVGALLSAPADAVVTELASGRHGPDWRAALDEVTGGEPVRGAGRLFAGLPQRMALFAIIITVQLLLFDFTRQVLNVSPENLALSLDVFADRLSFYEY